MSTAIPTYYENTFRHLNGVVSWKNMNYEYAGGNKQALELFGFTTEDDFIGKTDEDLNCEACHTVEIFQQQDQHVLSKGEAINILDINRFADGGISMFNTNKSPIIGETGVIGVLVQCNMITDPKQISAIVKLSNKDKKFISTLGSYAVTDVNEEFKLTDCEQVSLFYFLRGKSAKEIADLLFVSKRTIEFHINNIKLKLGCSNKSMLIEKAIEIGLMSHIPQGIIKNIFALEAA